MFRFTIRDMMWLTLAAAIGLAWLVERRQYSAIQHKYEGLMIFMLNAGYTVHTGSHGGYEVINPKTNEPISPDRSLWLQVHETNLDTVGLSQDRYEMRKALESEGYTIREENGRWKAMPPAAKSN